MEMNNFRGESHVAQQSRRDKLRVQNQNSEGLEDQYTNNFEQLSGVNPDLVQLRNLKYESMSYDPSIFSSDMLNYVRNSHLLVPQNESLVSAENVSVANLSHPVASNLNLSSSKVSGDPQNCSNWKSIGSQQSCDWINVNNFSSNPTNISEHGELGSLKVNNISASTLYMKQPSFYGYDDVVQPSLVDNPSVETSVVHGQKHFGEMQLCRGSSPYNYQSTLQQVVTSAGVGSQGQDIGRYVGKDNNELVLLPSFGNHHSNQMRVCNSMVDWTNRPAEAFRDWDGFRDRRAVADSSSTQGLSLSLSSVPQPNTTDSQFRERNDLSDPLEMKALKSDYLCSSSRPSIGSKAYGINRQTTSGISTILRGSAAAGPLGPFTGYAIILKNSKYLKPTLQLLDELCCTPGPKRIERIEVFSGKNSKEDGISSDHIVNAAENVVMTNAGGDSGASSSTFYSSNEMSGEGGVWSRANECYRPEYHQKKTKLLYMQEELSRRYKQYHQQMQMVVSSFEAVAGLSAATPYISMALKTVSRHFRSVKHAISDQLRTMGKALEEEMLSPAAGTTSNTRCQTSTSGLKFIDYGHQKQKSGGSNLVFFEPQQPVWRPQRGLPERAVAVLRAWLFDHFLHPYPTDTDKHMLASQTGLTRNQVSNWFINARVRLWKPMVEEIHILETKGSAESSSHQGKNGNPASENATNQYDDLPTNRPCGIDSSRSRDVPSAEVWNQEKRSRLECQIPAGMDGSLMSFLPYQRGGVESGGGLGAVSLTLGLRQSAETAQQQQQEQYRQHFGGQMIHDFVG